MLFRWTISLGLLFGGVAKADFITSVSKLNGLRADVEVHEKVIRNLLKDKKRAQNPKQMRTIMDKIVEHYNLMQKSVEKYERERVRTRVKYPSQQAQLKKYHPRYHFRPLDQMVKEDGVPEMLDKLSVFLDSQYGARELQIKISKQAKGNISGDMKAYQLQLQKQQSGLEDWNERPIISR